MTNPTPSPLLKSGELPTTSHLRKDDLMRPKWSDEKTPTLQPTMIELKEGEVRHHQRELGRWRLRWMFVVHPVKWFFWHRVSGFNWTLRFPGLWISGDRDMSYPGWGDNG